MNSYFRSFFRIIVSFALIVSLLSGSITPALAAALENVRAQDHMMKILETDLSVYEGERTPYSPPTDNSGVNPPTDNSGINPPNGDSGINPPTSDSGISPLNLEAKN